MPQGAYISVWDTIVPGREQQSLDVFQQLQTYWEGRRTDGSITERRAYLSTTPGDSGFEVVEGDYQTLAGLLADESHRDISILARAVLQGLRSHLCIDAQMPEGTEGVVAAESRRAYFEPWARVHPEVRT
jgi:hypothetical protein